MPIMDELVNRFSKKAPGKNQPLRIWSFDVDCGYGQLKLTERPQQHNSFAMVCWSLEIEILPVFPQPRNKFEVQSISKKFSEDIKKTRNTETPAWLDGIVIGFRATNTQYMETIEPLDRL